MSHPLPAGAVVAGKIGWLIRASIIFVICFGFMTMMSVLVGSYVYQNNEGLGAVIGILGSLVGGTALGILMAKWLA